MGGGGTNKSQFFLIFIFSSKIYLNVDSSRFIFFKTKCENLNPFKPQFQLTVSLIMSELAQAWVNCQRIFSRLQKISFGRLERSEWLAIGELTHA